MIKKITPESEIKAQSRQDWEKEQVGKICPLCQQEIKPPECWWKSYNCCSACIRKMAKEIQAEAKAEPDPLYCCIEDKLGESQADLV